MPLSRNAASVPQAATTAPPTAGPNARARLKPIAFSVTAAASSSRRHDLAHHRLPRRAVERRTGADQEGEQEQQRRRRAPRRRLTSDRPERGRRHPELGHQQDPAPVPQVGQRPSEQREQEDRRHGRGLDQGHHVRRAGQRGHQPGRTHAPAPASRPSPPGWRSRSPGTAAASVATRIPPPLPACCAPSAFIGST